MQVEAPASGGPAEHAIRGPAKRLRPSSLALFALLLGLLATAALSLTARLVYEHNETRLLHLRGRELDLVLDGIVPEIEAPLASADQLADLTGGNPARLRALIGAEVGAKRAFSSVSLWSLNGASGKPAPSNSAVKQAHDRSGSKPAPSDSAGKPAITIGAAPQVAGSMTKISAMLRAVRQGPGLKVLDMLDAPTPALAYAYASPAEPSGYAIYAESPLPKDRHLTVPSGEGLAGLHYALYLGRARTPAKLLLSDLRNPSRQGEQASFSVPFGSSALTLVVYPNGSLGGDFFESLTWIFAGAGLIVTLAAALMTDRLVRRRKQAEELAGALDLVARENRALYTEQHGITQTLQHALLPETLPQLQGLHSHARYVPSAQGIDVGGDWYDLVAVGEGQALLLIGDVSGHGLASATTMAALRHAALAYAVEDPQPSAVLSRLASFVGSAEHDYFATVLCGLIEINGHTVTLASAGHPAPLLLEDGQTRFPSLEVGVPIGVKAPQAGYPEICVTTSRGSILLAYTDGLVERRGESLDVGMQRLRKDALAAGPELDVLVDSLAKTLGAQSNDDTAILGVQWVI